MLYGRDAECARIGELLEAAREAHSGVLVLRGEAGAGKTALLLEARRQAADMQVLSGGGIESEAELPFAALHQLLRPILGFTDHLPAPQAAALRRALGLETGSGHDRFLVSLAVLSLIAEAADRRPILCLVDDAHWLDDASADALVFVSRRLEAEPIAILFAVRESEVRRFEPRGLPVLAVGGLDSAAAGELIDRQASPPLARDVRERLIEGSRGNPLALLELPSTLTAGQRSGAEPLLDPLPVGVDVERAFLERVRRLPRETQDVLLVAAADDTCDVAIVLRASAQLGGNAHALDAAEEAGLARVRGGRLELQHPLVRSAIYQGAPLSQRRAAHGAIASVLVGDEQADRRAWHRVAASVEPEPGVLDELEQAGERARRRSALAAASRAFERAAAFTRDEPRKARRLTAAAESAWLAGRLDRALPLLERARELTTDPILLADIDQWRGLIELNAGVPGDAFAMLHRAATEVAPFDSQRALALLNVASVAASFAGDSDAAIAIARTVRGLRVDQAPFALMIRESLLGIGALSEGSFAEAAATFRHSLVLEREIPERILVAEPSAHVFAARATLFLGDDRGMYRLHQRAASVARSTGALGTLTQILPRLAHAEVWAGHLAAASASVHEGMRLASGIGEHDLIAQMLVLRAFIAGQRGDEDECRSLVAEGRDIASARRLEFTVACSYWALAQLELGLGRADEAFRSAREISGTLSLFWSGPDRIEAAIRAGEDDAARVWLEEFEPWARHSEAAWALAGIAHCRALMSDDDAQTNRFFGEALEMHLAALRPFERARTELAWGEFLRRARRRVESREHLYAALDGFEQLGAAIWAARARSELRASGQTARKRDASTRDELTPQEMQIAGFVASGLTNREVAAQLFVSPRTVDFHLRNVFRKLGVTTRTELARLDPAQKETRGGAANPAISPVRA